MRAEIIAVGTELLLGEVLNTNAQYLSSECARLGIDVYHHVTVGDNRSRLVRALAEARERADLVLVTGGLGPTPDDITREAVAEAWGRKIVTDPELLDDIKTYFCNRHVEMTSNNESQAQMPEGAIPLRNSKGTAPGFYLDDGVAAVACLPGPPGELETMFSRVLVPLLDSKGLIPKSHLYSRDVLTAGLGESTAASMLEDLIERQTDPTIATYSSAGTVRIRLTTRAESPEEAEENFAAVLRKLKERIGEHIYGYDADTLSRRVGRDLSSRYLTLSLAESCTGGGLAAAITDTPGSSKYFLGGTVTYSNESKENLLGVATEILVEHGAVSEAVASAMAGGCRELFGSEIAISVTGVAGPGGGTDEKPVGTVCFGFAGPWGVETERHYFSGDRAGIRRRSCVYALVGLRRRLLRSG
ncbi:MAG: competence/damage-inducible protein A [Bacillota bacterium]